GKELEFQSGTLQQPRKRLASALPRKDCARALIVHDVGDIQQVQPGLTAECFQSRSERLCRYIATQDGSWGRLGVRGSRLPQSQCCGVMQPRTRLTIFLVLGRAHAQV